jgi:hypothetical protein
MESSWKEHEEFPFELYLMDIDNTWEDADHDEVIYLCLDTK